LRKKGGGIYSYKPEASAGSTKNKSCKFRATSEEVGKGGFCHIAGRGLRVTLSRKNRSKERMKEWGRIEARLGHVTGKTDQKSGNGEPGFGPKKGTDKMGQRERKG